MKVLYFTIGGEQYKVKENGDMLQVNNTYNDWNGDWQFWGYSDSGHLINRDSGHGILRKGEMY